MVLNKWTTGDSIDEIPANNRGIRKGTESDLAGITTAANEEGDITYNSTTGFPNVQIGGGATDTRGNLTCAPIGADSTEVSQLGTTPLLVKELDFIKSNEGCRGNTIVIVAMLKTSANNATIIMEVDGGPTDEITQSTASTSYVKVTGSYDATGLSNDAVHNLEFYIYTDNAGATATLKQLEVYAI